MLVLNLEIERAGDRGLLPIHVNPPVAEDLCYEPEHPPPRTLCRRSPEHLRLRWGAGHPIYRRTH